MTDRGLLEAAARAAGIVVCWKEKADAGWGGKICGFFLPSGRQGGNGRRWNPLADDGDALRLAVKLDIVPRCISSVAFAWRDGVCDIQEPINGDPYAATRRAIVRAAAAPPKEPK